MSSPLAAASWTLLIVGMLWSGRLLAEPALERPTPEPTVQSTAPAPADPDADRKAEAEALRLRALGYYDAGDYGAAQRDFEQAYQLHSSFRLLYNLGVVSLALADPSGAYDYFQRCLALGGTDVPADRRNELEQQLRELSTRTALLTIVVDVPGAVISVDDRAQGTAPLARPLRRNPGPVRVAARLADGRNVSRAVSLAPGQSLQVDLKLIVPPPPLVHHTGVAPKHRLPWAGWAATAVLTTGSVVAGLEALSSQHEYEHALTNIGTSRAELDRLDTRATRWSVATDTLTGAAIIVGIYSLYSTLLHAPASSSTSNTSRVFPIQVQVHRYSVGISF